MKRTYSIIIVTFNGLELLKTYLPGVFHSLPAGCEVIIADNASKDATREWLETHCREQGIAYSHTEIPTENEREQTGSGTSAFNPLSKSDLPNLKSTLSNLENALPKLESNSPLSCAHLKFSRNLGYADGNNRAADFAQGEILLFLNNDVRVEPGWLESLNEAFNDSGTAVAQPKILSERNHGWFDYAGASGGFMDEMGYPYARGRLFTTLEKDEGQYDDSVEIFWASGAALAIRSAVFRQLDGFPGDFEFHMEEIDLCWRVWKAGHSIYVWPDSVVHHVGGASLAPSNPRKTFYNFRNSLLMLLRNLDTPLWRIRILLRLFLDGFAAVAFLLRGGWPHVAAIAKAHWDFFRRVKATMAQRRILRETQIREGGPSTMRPFCILIPYYLKGVKRYQDL